MTLRVLITGSREWDDWDTIFDALSKVKTLGDIVVVHGGARGADEMAGLLAQRLGLKTEVHKADWQTHGKRAGYVRNAEMVKAGADMCLAFIKDSSKGATMCAELAEKASIPVKYFREES